MAAWLHCRLPGKRAIRSYARSRILRFQAEFLLYQVCSDLLRAYAALFSLLDHGSRNRPDRVSFFADRADIMAGGDGGVESSRPVRSRSCAPELRLKASAAARLRRGLWTLLVARYLDAFTG
jgi:hypothetical protein